MNSPTCNSRWQGLVLLAILVAAVVWVGVTRVGAPPDNKHGFAARASTRIVDTLMMRKEAPVPPAIMALPPDDVTEYHQYNDAGERILSHEHGW